MNRYPATPGEFERLMSFLDPVPADRRPAIAWMLFEEADVCGGCDRSVRRCDSRRRVDDRIWHFGCGGGR